MGMYLAPMASQGFNEFKYKYLKRGKEVRTQTNVYRQINENDYIYVNYFNVNERKGNNFTLEHFEGNRLDYKIKANSIQYNDVDSTYTLSNYLKRTITENGDILESKKKFDQDGDFHFEKHKIFLYKEDFDKFKDGFIEVIDKVISLNEANPVENNNSLESKSFKNVD